MHPDMQSKPAALPAPFERPGEPDLALIYLGSLFETLQEESAGDDTALEALAAQILEHRAQTPLGLVIKARATKWLSRHLWMTDFDTLSPSEQAVRVVIDSAARIPYCDRPS